MSRKKPTTAADRPQFRRDLLATLGALNMGVAELSSDMTILCTKGSDFDPDTNALWEDYANKSAVRHDVHCVACNCEVAMSHHAYGRYKSLDKKPRVVCSACAGEYLK